MAEITPDQANMLDALSQMVRGSASSFTSTPSSRSDTPSSKQSPEDRANRIRAEKASSNLADASKLFAKSVKKDYKTKEQWKLQVDQSKDFMNNAVAAIKQSNVGVGATAGLEKMFHTEQQLDVLTEIREGIMADAKNKYGKELPPEVTAQIEQSLRQVGLKFEDIGDITTENVTVMEEVNGVSTAVVKEMKYGLIPNFKKLDKKTDDVSKNLKKASDGLEDLVKSSDNAKKATQGIFAAAGVSAKMFVDESRIAMRKGVGDARDGFADTATMIAKLGISTSKYMELMADNRRVQLAMNSAGKSWKSQLVTTTNELMKNKLVGSMEEAAVAAAGFMKNTASMGVAQNELEDAVGRQSKIYENNFRALAISTDQFNALTEDMLNDVDIKKDLAKMQGKERQAYIESLQKRTAENVMMGYSIERAKELNKHFAKISEEDPLQRLESAAKLRTGLGAVGMGDEGARVQELMAKLPTLKGEDKIGAQEEITKILAAAQTRFQELKGQDVGSNVAYGQIESMLGIKEVLTLMQTELAEGKKIAKEGQTGAEASADASMKQRKNEVNDSTALAVRAADTFQAAATSSATVAATMLASYVFAGGLQKSMGIVEGLLAKSALGGDVVGGTAGGAGKAGKLMKGAGVVGAAMIGWEVGTAIGDQITDAWKGTDSYESFSDGLGTFIDTIASAGGLGSQEATDRLARMAELQEKQLEETKRANEAARQTATNTGKTNDSIERGTEQGAIDSEKNRQYADKKDRLAAQDNNKTAHD